MRRLSRLFIAGALVLTAACGGGDDSSDEGSDGPTRALFQPAGVVGPDAFSPSFAAATYQASAAVRASSGAALSELSADEPAAPIAPGSTVTGSTPGLYAGRTYGGTGANICDVEKMIEFLTAYEDRGRAWAAIQGIPYEQLGAYLRDLTPVFTLQDINVTMFGFKNGQSYGYDAVIAAGTAILIDEQGMPRARCACGNPLLGPSEDIPEGTDEPTPDDPADGNPQTQDSVPPDTGDVPTDEPNEQPRPEREPECPDWNNPPPRYVDTNGMLWQFNPFTERWISLDDPDLVNIPAEDMPGYVETCVQPDRRVAPVCPTQTDEGWTLFQNSNGDTFEYALLAGWTNTATGERYESVTDLPGYLDDCGTPDVDGPCPPTRPRHGDIWTDPEGTVWIAFGFVGGDSDSPGSRDSFGWINTTTNESVSVWNLSLRFCGDLDVAPLPEPQCPPQDPSFDEIWVDTRGDAWVYAPNKGGVAGWDNLSTSSVEVLRNDELPNVPEGCDPTTTTTIRPCPPILNIPEGYSYNGSNGSTYVWSPASGGWLGDSGDVIVYTVLLPGYRQLCLPPCPPADYTTYPVPGIWVDPSNGDIWIKPSAGVTWINIRTREGLKDTRDLPFWRAECLPPCAPGSNGEPTYVKDEDGRPIPTPALANQYASNVDGAITIVPGDGYVQPARIFPELLGIVTATGDDCNPAGCVDLTTAPALGHLIVDSFGIEWRYSSDGLWQSENGDSIDSVLFIPGYTTACPIGDEVPPRDCPTEFEGTRYTDSRNITWTWVGTNTTPEESQHERKWFTVYEDGTYEYRYTFQLDPSLVDCPKPADLDVPPDIVVTTTLPPTVCAGERGFLKIVVVELVEGATVQLTISINGTTVASAELGAGLLNRSWSAGEPGVYEFGFAVEASNRFAYEYIQTVDVIDCDAPTTQVDNGEPRLTAEFVPLCTEVVDDPPGSVVLRVNVGGFDGDAVDITVNGGDDVGSPEIIVPEQRRTVSNADTVEEFIVVIQPAYAYRFLEFTIGASDGTTSLTTTAFVSVQGPGGCGGADPSPDIDTDLTPEPATTSAPATMTAPATTTTTTRPPATTTTTTTTRPPATVAPNQLPDVSYDLDSSRASSGVCTVRVSAVDVDPGQTVYIGANVGEAASSTFGEVTRNYEIAVSFTNPNATGSLPSGHAAFDSAGGRVALSYTVRITLGNNGYTCVRV